MINKYKAKRFCSEDISLIENYHEAISDDQRMWDTHHRRECDSEGRTLLTKKQLIDMGLYFKRPASELIFVTRAMHWKLHRELREKCGKIVGKKYGKIGGKIGGGSEAAKEAAKEKCSIHILQFTKDGTFVKEWPSLSEACRQLGVSTSHICNCLKGRKKSAGGYVWRYNEFNED